MINVRSLVEKEPLLWDLYTRREEYESPIRDQYDRFPYYASKNRDIFEPKVSEYLVRNGTSFEYPENKSFAVCLTHDIDIIYSSVLMKGIIASSHLRHGRISRCWQSIADMRSKKIPWWNFSEITKLEDKYGARSSFYFMAENPSEIDYSYNIYDCEAVLGELVDSGYEIGLHGGHTTYTNLDEMVNKKQRLEKILNRNITGYRNHYLRFQVPETWEFLHGAGFKYDVTFGYADCAGFRNGMCHPFRPFNLKTGQEIDIIEIPLAIMDCTLDQYMKLNPAGSWDMTRRLIDTTERYNGVLTILWHNTYFYGDMAKFYEKILEYCVKKGAWLTCGEDIFKTFNKHYNSASKPQGI